jgi:hypothetical protein
LLQLEFFAEDEEVTIIPDFGVEADAGKKIIGIQVRRSCSWYQVAEFSEGRLGHSLQFRSIAQGTWGPFQPGFPVKVPLWMAVYLHQRKQCRVLTPAWLSVDYLQGDYATGERDSRGGNVHRFLGADWLLCFKFATRFAPAGLK